MHSTPARPFAQKRSARGDRRILKLPATLHAEATSFRAASTTFGRLVGVMNQQCRSFVERAGHLLMRDPLTAFRSADDEAVAESQ